MESRKMKLESGGLTADVRLEGDTAVIDGRSVAFRVTRQNGEIVAVETEGRIFPVRVFREGRRAAQVWCAGRGREVREASSSARAREAGGDLLAPMPGLVRRVEVKEGAPVTRGQVLMILEAMKMEHAIRAPRDGVVSRVAYEEGDLVEAGAPLVEIS
jgi:biotin carboxyl carrier protein